MTLFLGRSDLLGVFDLHACIDRLWDGFTAGAAPVEAQRVRTELPGPGTATALIPGLLPGVPAYSVKVNAKFPGARPALRGVVCLHDLGSGELLALLDSATLTAWRTGLSAALAAHTLARFDAEVLGIVGCGAQAGLFSRGIIGMRPVSRLVVADTDRSRAEAFAQRCAEEFGVPATVAEDAPAVAAEADIVLTATWSRTPLLSAADVRPGTQVTSLGADEPGKVELAADLLRAARVVVDDARLALSSGAVGNAGLDASAIDATLGEVLGGTARGSAGPDGVGVYAPVGVPWQDLALAWYGYRAAADRGTGTALDLLA
ncbi:ornithine cyclodeaminase family protein [Nocardiopsis halophila]|uniref:ornithine cyclodeaminase family protein n=1 Tax=Nocardiopsis halophila TaxID=141692 RepID=UPI00034856DF|nr:ornithine cyclodeaminase family protein [Nocardiopsis halophila]